MVRNRRDEPGWWDDLPPRIRERFATPVSEESGESVAVAEAPPRRSLAWLRDSSLFAIIMIGIALANLFFLLLVFALVDGPAPSR
jgi:hypothetical protein